MTDQTIRRTCGGSSELDLVRGRNAMMRWTCRALCALAMAASGAFDARAQQPAPSTGAVGTIVGQVLVAETKGPMPARRYPCGHDVARGRERGRPICDPQRADRIAHHARPVPWLLAERAGGERHGGRNGDGELRVEDVPMPSPGWSSRRLASPGREARLRHDIDQRGHPRKGSRDDTDAGARRTISPHRGDKRQRAPGRGRAVRDPR